MLKSQDCIILLKLLANPKKHWSQRLLSKELGISLSEINGGIKRLHDAHLIRKDQGQFVPILAAAAEYLIYGLKYHFPGKLEEYTRGIPTAVAAPLFANKIALGQDPLPVWPYALGNNRGVALKPLHPSVPQALNDYPDASFYDLLVLIDTIRVGRARERNMAIQMLKDKLDNANQ
jgi:DNA-binding Lrp family transcriptional regulator